jgi:hypothetical protein
MFRWLLHIQESGYRNQTHVALRSSVLILVTFDLALKSSYSCKVPLLLSDLDRN